MNDQKKNEDEKNENNNNSELEQEIEELLDKKEQDEAQEVEELGKKESNEFEEKYKRALADYQNLQRRTDEQKREWIMQAGRSVILKLLPVFDTLQLAQKHLNDKGLAISIDQFLQVLGDEGVTKIKTVGETFNPHTMEAIGTTEGENEKVIEEVRTGFMLHDTVLRSAQVIVGKK